MESIPHNSDGLRKDAVGLLGIVFFVIATNGPLTALVGAVPAAIAFGNGIGLPGVYLVTGLLYLLFTVGFAAMGQYIRNAGAFYAYVSNGLGRPAGVGAAFLAIVAYNSLQLACYAMFGFFASQLLQTALGIVLPWWAVCLAFVLLIQYFGSRNIEFNGKMLGLLMLAEMAIITLFDLGVVFHGGGPEGFSVAPFVPEHVFAKGFGSAIVFVVSSYMGFETTAIYSEEARDPKRTIPLATYIAVFVIMAFYAVSTWLLVVAYGSHDVVTLANKDPGNLWFAMSTKLVGKWSADVMNVLMITSLFAAILSFHNTISRYFFALGREGILWHKFAHLHPEQQTPVVASTVQTVLMLVAVALCAYFKADPMTVVLPIASAPSSLGIVAVQALAALAVVGFFWKNTRGASLWQRLIAPLLSFAGLAYALYLMMANMALLTGGDGPLNWIIPVVMVAVGVFGFGYALWLRRNRPALYQNLARLLSEV